MSLSLANIVNATKEVTVTYAGESFAVHYKPASFTPEMEAGLRESADKAASEVLPRLLERLVDHADITDLDGTPLAFAESRLLTVPTALQKEIVDSILKDIVPGEESAG